MLITEGFVFVHVAKTGGEFISNALRQTCDVQEIGSHIPFRDTPSEFRELPAICFVRNPWDWYVSWWHWVRAREGERRDFPVWLRHHFEEPKDTYQRAFEWMTGERRDRSPLLYVARFETLREDFIGFLDQHQIGNEALREAVLVNPPANTSNGRTHYRDYYDEATKALVGSSPMAAGYEF